MNRSKTITLLLGALLLPCALAADTVRPHGNGNDPDDTFVAGDGVAEDAYGSSVAVSDDYVAIGAFGGENGQGKLYVYDRETKVELLNTTIDLNGGSRSELLGQGGIAISGDRIVIGAVGVDVGGSARGAAFVYDLNAIDPTIFDFQLDADDTAEDNALFGVSVAVSGDIALIGAPSETAGAQESGAAYVFDITTGTELFRFTSNAPASVGGFGAAVAISGNLALVGAPRENGGPAGTTDKGGSVHVFDLTTGSFLRKITLSADKEAGLGSALSVSGDQVLVGAFLEDVEATIGGTAYLFDIATGNQIRRFEPTLPETGSNILAGTKVQLDGLRAIVGVGAIDALWNFLGLHEFHVYNASSGELLYCITSNIDGEPIDLFGSWLAADDSEILIGNPSGNRDAMDMTGSTAKGDVGVYEDDATAIPDVAALNTALQRARFLKKIRKTKKAIKRVRKSSRANKRTKLKKLKKRLRKFKKQLRRL